MGGKSVFQQCLNIGQYWGVEGEGRRRSGPQTIFKIMDLDTVDDNFSFGMSPPNRDSSKVKLFVVLDDPKTKWGVGTGFTTELQPRRQGMLRHISFVFKTKVMVVQKMLVVRLERIAAYNGVQSYKTSGNEDKMFKRARKTLGDFLEK